MQKFLAKNWIYVLTVVMLLVVGALIYAKKNKERKADEIRRINEILDSDTGLHGIDVKTLTHGIARAQNFDAAPYAKVIYNAKSYWNDDEQAIYDAFSGKSRAQVASISDYFLATYGKDLDKYLESFLNAEEFATVIDIIKLAK